MTQTILFNDNVVDTCNECGRDTDVKGKYPDGTFVNGDGFCMQCDQFCTKCGGNMHYSSKTQTTCPDCGHVKRITTALKEQWQV